MHISLEKMENILDAILFRGQWIATKYDRRPILGEQKGLLNEDETLSNKNYVQVFDMSESQGKFQNHVSPINLGEMKMENGKISKGPTTQAKNTLNKK